MRLLLAMLACTAGAALGQSQSLAQGPHKIDLTLERMEGSTWRAIDPGLVLSVNDRVRFRCRTNFDGYLYVVNRGTTGGYTLLFPREETGRQNDVKAGRDYMVPATEGWFTIAGPPGFDVIYWMISPVMLEGRPSYLPLPPPPKLKAQPPNLLPRCDDAMFRSRGLCIDPTAGPRNISENEQLPEGLPSAAGAASRDLVIVQKQNQATVASPAPLTGPVIYEFRLAHR